jgi:hypothetical protein
MTESRENGINTGSCDKYKVGKERKEKGREIYENEESGM